MGDATRRASMQRVHLMLLWDRLVPESLRQEEWDDEESDGLLGWFRSGALPVACHFDFR